MSVSCQHATFRATGYRLVRNSDKMPALAGASLATMEAAMVQRILGWLTIALLAASVIGSNSSASPLEDSLAAPAERGACTNEFVPLREEAEARGRLIKVASERHAPPEEACKLIGNFGQSEAKMIKYIEANAEKCGIPPEVAERLRAGHKNTEVMQKKICAMAQQAQRGGPTGPVGDFDHIGAPPLVR
jgi:hypothetical protein